MQHFNRNGMLYVHFVLWIAIPFCAHKSNYRIGMYRKYISYRCWREKSIKDKQNVQCAILLVSFLLSDNNDRSIRQTCTSLVPCSYWGCLLSVDMEWTGSSFQCGIIWNLPCSATTCLLRDGFCLIRDSFLCSRSQYYSCIFCLLENYSTNEGNWKLFGGGLLISICCSFLYRVPRIRTFIHEITFTCGMT